MRNKEIDASRTHVEWCGSRSLMSASVGREACPTSGDEGTGSAVGLAGRTLGALELLDTHDLRTLVAQTCFRVERCRVVLGDRLLLHPVGEEEVHLLVQQLRARGDDRRIECGTTETVFNTLGDGGVDADVRVVGLRRVRGARALVECDEFSLVRDLTREERLAQLGRKDQVFEHSETTTVGPAVLDEAGQVNRPHVVDGDGLLEGGTADPKLE